jgi:sulfoquinovosidase
LSDHLPALDEKGISMICYTNPMFVDVAKMEAPFDRNLYAEGIAHGYFVTDAAGAPYMLPVTAFDVALLDLTNPDARNWMKQVLKEEVVEAAGCSGWMVDFAEVLPFDARLHSGVDAARFHNLYPVEWVRLHREAVEEMGKLGELLLFNRAGYTQTPSHSLLMWEGDQMTDWHEFDGLTSALHGLLSGGFSGIALNHSDTGGYTSLSTNGNGINRSAELLMRWAEMNAFTAVLRTHEGNQPGENVQVYSSDEVMDHFARFSRVYAALSFHREQLFQDATAKGYPVVRHLLLHYPDDMEAHQVQDQFLLGSDILVAPVTFACDEETPCQRQVYFPAGEWVHLWSGQTYGDSAAGTSSLVPASLGEPAVFYAMGSATGEALLNNLAELGVEVGQ